MKNPDRQAAAAAIDSFLRALGIDDPDVTGTGARVAEMFIHDLCQGYAVDSRRLVEDSTIDVTAPSTVIVRDIPVVTTCPHHLLPSIGKATVAFKALRKVVGLGAVGALVDAHARRLALQERIGEGVVEDLEAAIAPEWVGCRVVLVHGCMVARGERTMGTSVETIALRGAPASVLEAHRALGVGGAS